VKGSPPEVTQTHKSPGLSLISNREILTSGKQGFSGFAYSSSECCQTKRRVHIEASLVVNIYHEPVETLVVSALFVSEIIMHRKQDHVRLKAMDRILVEVGRLGWCAQVRGSGGSSGNASQGELASSITSRRQPRHVPVTLHSHHRTFGFLPMLLTRKVRGDLEGGKFWSPGSTLTKATAGGEPWHCQLGNAIG
jgi:hypothetical protein